jgi:hypothetical protein
MGLKYSYIKALPSLFRCDCGHKLLHFYVFAVPKRHLEEVLLEQ